ncbi:MAG TPA: tetratricopeptide repeat protein [Candidatus Angelobacter sp.]|nr:tetratricopeptide repeat protein [Candidatus Angelobacter sp.]
MLMPPLATRSSRRTILITISLVILCYTASGQQAASTQQADELFAASKWEQAASAYARITAQDPANGPAWQRLGECNLQLQRFDQAINAFQRAVDLNYRPLMTKVDLARVYAAKSEPRRALQVLKDVAATGQAPRLRGYIARAAELQKLGANADYQEFLKSTLPCQTAEFRQFDFWIGDWDVHNPAGQKVGDNQITREQDGCLLVEHWKSGRGIETGTSFNYFDVRDKKFHQIYFDNSGNAGAYPPMAGGVVDNKMIMISDEKVSPIFRWTWYVLSPGKVRQMAEQSDDQQKTWRVIWDSTYVSKAQQAGK